MISVITVTTLMGVLSYGLSAAGQGAAPKLTDAQVREAATKELPVLMKEASGVSIRRVNYGPGTQTKQPAWLVSLDGLSIASSGPHGMAKTFNTQMHLILDDNGQRIVSYTYQ
jgi:hypothetical protein